MKRLLYLLSIMTILTLTLGASVAASDVSDVTVTLNGETIDCASYGQEATIVEGRTLVPLRAIFEALGASVEWEQSTKTVVSRLDTTMIDLTVGEKELRKFTLDSEGYIIDGQTVILDVPAMIMNGRTMVPARVVAESFGVSVGWDGESRTVSLMRGVYAYNAYLDGVLENLEPKTELDKEILVTVEGIPISAACVRSYVMQACNGGLDVTDENVKKQLEVLYKQDASLINFAYNEKILLETADINQLKAKIFTLQLQLGEVLDKAFADSPYTKFFYHHNASLVPVVFSKIVSAYSGADNQEMRRKVLEYFEANNYIRAKHILVMLPGVNEGRESTEQERNEAFSKALDILVKVKAMKNPDEFDALVEEYNEDPGMKSSPDGYYFTYGKMVEPFEKAAFALEIGGTSSIVETDYGFHIIQRLPLDDECMVNVPEYKSAVSEVLFATTEHIAKGYEVKYSDNYDERVNDFVNEYRKIMEETK